MNRLLIILFFSYLPFAVSAQSFSERRKADRNNWYKEKENAEKERNNVQNETLDDYLSAEAFKNFKFVFEADRLTSKYGNSIYVNSGTNFVSLCGDEVVVQISPMDSYPGFNGVGGITLDGRASDITIAEDKKGALKLSMSVTGVAISVRINITFMPGSESAFLTILPNFNSNRIDLMGKIVPLEKSDVFKGSSI